MSLNCMIFITQRLKGCTCRYYSIDVPTSLNIYENKRNNGYIM